MLRDLDDALREIYELKNTTNQLVREIVQLKHGIKINDWVKTKDGLVQVYDVNLVYLRAKKGDEAAVEYTYDEVEELT